MSRFTKTFGILGSGIFCAGIVLGCTVPKEVVPMIAGDATKVQLLQQAVQKFQQALQWKDAMLAIEFISPQLAPTVIKKMLGDPKTTSVFAVSIEEFEVDKPAPGKAEVSFELQVYGSPTYSVRTVNATTEWEFSRYDGGWKLISASQKPASAEIAKKPEQKAEPELKTE